MMNKAWKIIQWEVMRNLRNKQFIIGLLITPLIILLFAGVPTLLQILDKPVIHKYLVADEIGILDSLIENIPVDNLILEGFGNEEEDIEAEVDARGYTGYLLLDSDFQSSGMIEIHYSERNLIGERILQSLLTGYLQQQRMQESGVDADQLDYLTASVELRMTPLEEAVVPETKEIIVSAVFLGLIFYLIFASGSMLMQSSLQEKRDRMAEIMLSSVRASQLMSGKIIGQFLLGMIQLLFWIVISVPALIYFLDFPIIQALAETNLLIIGLFGLFGYLLFSSMFVSMGATMEDLQSAGNSQGMVMIIPLISVLFLTPVITNPNGIISRFASIFPITSPFIMVLRNALTRVPTWEIALSIVLLVLSALFIIRLTGKIFRTGMLMYGKTATIGEIFRWLNYREE